MREANGLKIKYSNEADILLIELNLCRELLKAQRDSSTCLTAVLF